MNIKSMLREKGISQTALATYVGVSATVVNQVVNSKARNRRVEIELEKIAGCKLFGPNARPGPKPTSYAGVAA